MVPVITAGFTELLLAQKNVSTFAFNVKLSNTAWVMYPYLHFTDEQSRPQKMCKIFPKAPLLTSCLRSVQLKPTPTQNSRHTPSPYLLAFLQGLEELIRGTPQIFSYRLFVWGAVQGSLLFWEGAPVSEPAWSHLSSAILLLLAIPSN